MDAVYPEPASALARGRRLRRGPQRARTRTQPVTFAEIKEVDEESEGASTLVANSVDERRRRDELSEPPARGVLGVQRACDALALELVAPRADCRRRATHCAIPEPPDEARASSEPRAPPP